MLLVTVLSAAAHAGNPEQLVEELLPRVVKVMGLPMSREVKLKVVTRAEAEQRLRGEVDAQAQQRLGEALLAIGLLPEGTRLETLAPDFNRQHVSGFYDLREHTLFLLADEPDEAQRPIVAHELAHAVQDAHVELHAAMKTRRGSEDAALAFLAVVEGQAQATAALVMDGWLRDQHVAVEGMAGLLSDTTARSAAEAADQAPVPWLGLQLRFPYVAGRALIAARASPEDPIARGLLRAPPASTAQVMTPGLTLPPLTGAFRLQRLIPGAKASLATTLGRANLELLGEGLGEGWLGDRLEAVHVGKRLVVGWSVAFTTPAQCEQFAAVIRRGASCGRGIAVVLSGVEADQAPRVRNAALSAFGARVPTHGPDHPAPEAPGVRGK